MELPERLAALSDFAAVAACQDLADALAKRRGAALLDDADTLGAALPRTADAAALKAGLLENYHLSLPPEVSIELARAMLAAAAAEPELAPLLEQLLDENRDTRQFALEVLALGAAISMVIVSATTTRDKDGFGKQALSPELAEKLGAWLDKLRPWVSPAKPA